ncbi:TSUP family transporter [Lampropedia aestuarii]|uniref:TSUP family transporter n=1 Tax=Lampropedia aestuarii TaxID=2562762 RepID=UPI0024685C57|nr:TSUP family transporter [Lampropedia aestuarii]MDH5858707.1 TSUP family transporter [Lampropedia aestuarii]
MLPDPGLPIADIAAFLLCVALATAIQNVTGFAFGLVLLGLSASLHIASVSDAANAAMVLTLVNAAVSFSGGRARPPWRLMRPALLGSAAGVAIGVVSLAWLSSNAVVYLRALLGITIIACAAALLWHSKPLHQLSKPAAFVGTGFLSGLLGGLFSSSGPPLVYHMYRQPLSHELVRQALLLAFAFNACLRLVFVIPAGQMSAHSMVLAACAIPVVFGITRWQLGRPIALPQALLKKMAAALLVLSGLGLLVSSLQAIA